MLYGISSVTHTYKKMKIHEASEYLMASSSTSENIARGSLAVTKCLPAPVFLPTIQLQASLLYEAHGTKPQRKLI